MIVVDASVLVNVLADDAEPGDVARDRLAREPQLSAPHLLDLEVMAALRSMFRRGALTRQRATTALVQLAGFPVKRFDHTPLLHRVWGLRDALTAYDASYLALAETLGCPLLTGDTRLAKGAEHAESSAEVEVLTG